MKIRFSFDMDVPERTEAATLRAAGDRAICAAENAIEHALESGPKPHAARGGVCRITIKSNEHDGCPF